MPLAQPLAELRHNLEAQIREGQLPDALNALLAQLPDGSENYRIVSALIARLNAANKERYRNTISAEEYQRRVDQVSADFFDLLSGLKERDFEAEPASTNAAAGKQGSVLYRVPHVMTIQKPVRCTIRVAVNEDVILENIVLDEHVEVKSRVEISDVMSAELVDPEGGTFQITPLNKHTQLIKETGYTEWNFNVTPLIEGVHQLLVKVSIMEVVPGFAEPIPREVSLMETVTIVTEGKAPSDTPSEEFKPSGQTFDFQSTSTVKGNYDINYSKSIELPPESTNPSMPKSYNRNLRALALFLAFLVIVPVVAFATAPEFSAYVIAIVRNTPEAYTDFIENHPNSPRIEKAYFYRAEASGQLTDFRTYQEKFQQGGKYEDKVLARIGTLETKSLENIRKRPDSLKIKQFVDDFPESERLEEVKQAVGANVENRYKFLDNVEDAYVASIKALPTKAKVEAYLRDFPNYEKLDDVDAATRTRPEVFQKVKSVLEEAYLKKMEKNQTQIHSDPFIEKFPQPMRLKKFGKISDKSQLNLTVSVYDADTKVPINGTTTTFFDLGILKGGNFLSNKSGGKAEVFPKDSNTKNYKVDYEHKYQILTAKEGYVSDISKADSSEVVSTIGKVDGDTIEVKLYLHRPSALEELLPITLYFDNDYPKPIQDPKYLDTTLLDYQKTFVNYIRKKEEFKREFTEVLTGQEKLNELDSIEHFFEQEVRMNWNAFFSFSSELGSMLEAGDTIILSLKGYVSPLSNPEYSNHLTNRRIASVYNHFMIFDGGFFRQYLQFGGSNQLRFIREPNGNATPAPDKNKDLKNLRLSVYDYKICREQRIQIIGAKVIKSSKTKKRF
ncbi:MAG: hypothetical protein ACKVU0_04450 [Saprospiraceae bacterium]